MLETLKALGLGAVLTVVGWFLAKHGIAFQEAGAALLRGKRVELGNFQVAVVRIVSVAFLSLGATVCAIALMALGVTAVRAIL